MSDRALRRDAASGCCWRRWRLMVVGTTDIRALRALPGDGGRLRGVHPAGAARARTSTASRGTLMDAPVYVFDSGVPGGSVLILGGAHPYEPASPMMAYVRDGEHRRHAGAGCSSSRGRT